MANMWPKRESREGHSVVNAAQARSAEPVGPVSQHLLDELTQEVRRQGIVVWLDRDQHYTDFVDQLVERRQQGQLKFDVVAFRGSFLELMLATQPLAGGVDRSRLLVHMPGFNEEAIRETPVFELYASGVRFRRALDTLVEGAAGGRVRPDQLEAFRQQPELSLAMADTWLCEQLNAEKGGLAANLKALTLTALVDDLLGKGFVASRIKDPGNLDALWHHLEALAGLDPVWRDTALQGLKEKRSEDVAYVVASWAMCVEYVHDLRRPPHEIRLEPCRNLPQPVIHNCHALCDHLRERHIGKYRDWARAAEGWLDQEIQDAVASDLGEIDTFEFEENTILGATIQAVSSGYWQAALDWALPRVKGKSFWASTDSQRHAAWLLVLDAADLVKAIDQAGAQLGNLDNHDIAVERYVSKGVAVDLAHRRLEQHRAALLYPGVAWRETLQPCLDGLRQLWRGWADAWTRDYGKLCVKEGWLPNSGLQQRNIFEQVVRPLIHERETVALFVVDALRFEMAEELRQSLADMPATTVDLKAWLAELPTVTEIGMNALAPVARDGRMQLVHSNDKLRGFGTGEFQVLRPEQRQKAMHDRVGGDTCPWLSLQTVVNRDLAKLKQTMARARLLVVHSTEIDAAGEGGGGLVVFDHVLKNLRAAHKQLREAGVRRFVITADHGFLLLCDSVQSALPHGRKVDPKRRYVLGRVAADHSGELRVPLAELGYDNAEDLQLMVPDTTAVFDTGKRAQSFVHGGNSLQERVIPVLTLQHRAAAGGTQQSYTIQAGQGEGMGDMHCLAAKVSLASQIGLSFGGQREVELGLRVVDPPEVEVELCYRRHGARLLPGTIVASVDKEFEVFFRLHGQNEGRARIELYPLGSGVDLAPFAIDARYAVHLKAGSVVSADAAPAPTGHTWLEDLPAGAVRQFFEHLDAHGVVTEIEAMKIMGSPSHLRRFSPKFELYAALVPFEIRIDNVGGVKRYVKEG